MKILITGGLGHIGSKLMRALPKNFKKIEIYVLDNFSTQRYVSLFNLNNRRKYKFFDIDILDNNFDFLIKKIDIVVHLAAITDATNSFNIQSKVYKNNFGSTKLIVDKCSRYKKKLIFISSTSVYGSHNKIVDETSVIDKLSTTSPYALCKLKEEKYLTKFIKQKKIEAIILRFGTIVGKSPGIRFHTAVNKFCFQASHDMPLTIWQTAFKQKRPYLGINDACRSIIFVIKKNLFNQGIFNVLSGNFTVSDIVKMIKSNKSKVKITFVKNKIMNQLSYEVSNNKITKYGFKFKDKMKKIIKEEMSLLN